MRTGQAALRATSASLLRWPTARTACRAASRQADQRADAAPPPTPPPPSPPTAASPRQAIVTAHRIPNDEGALTPYTYKFGYPGLQMLFLVYDTVMQLDAEQRAAAAARPRGAAPPPMASPTTSPSGRACAGTTASR